MTEPADVVRRLFQAFNDDDRETAKALIAEDYRFTTPLDNGIDKASFFARCWPGDNGVSDFRIERSFVDGDTVVTVFEAGAGDGRRIRNVGLNRIRDGRIFEAEAYFGWSLPHPATSGGWVEQA
jgi:ketosteroid isomerase-like protein